MVTVVKIDIHNKEILDQYNKILIAQNAGIRKGEQGTEFLTNRMEDIIARTLFKGVNVRAGKGRNDPDFLITNPAMNQLLRKITKGSVPDIDRFNKYVADQYGAPGEMVETKFMRNLDRDDIKIGATTIEDTTGEAQKFFDFTTGGIIDTTKLRMITELREAYRAAGVSAAPVPTELKKKLKFANLTDWIKTATPDFKAFVAKDPHVMALRKILEKDKFQSMSGDQISKLVDQINNKWAVSALDSELTQLSRQNKLFDYITQVPGLRSQFYLKSRNLTIFRRENNKVSALMLHFRPTDFTSKFFSAKYSNGQIDFFLKSGVEEEFHNQLLNAQAVLTLEDSLEAFDKAVAQLGATINFKELELKGFNTTIQYVIPSGGSIPMSKGRFKSVKREYIKPPLIRDGSENITAFAPKQGKSQFLSGQYLSLLIRQRVSQLMPHGPIGGAPLSRTKLTYRTGRFVNSIEIIPNYRQRILRYYYNPIYYVHEATRDPRKLIETGIRQIARERFTSPFNISMERS